MRAFLLFKSKVLARTLASCENCSATIGPLRIVVRAFGITAFFVLLLYHIFYRLSTILWKRVVEDVDPYRFALIQHHTRRGAACYSRLFFGTSRTSSPTKVSLCSERTVEFSLRLGRVRVLTSHRDVIHYAHAASLRLSLQYKHRISALVQ